MSTKAAAVSIVQGQLAKKVKSLTETFPQLNADSAALVLNQYDGSLKLATEAVLSGDKWTRVEKVKKPKRDEATSHKAVEQSTPVERRPKTKDSKDTKDFSNKEQRKERKPRLDAPTKVDNKAVPATVAHRRAETSDAAAAPVVHQRAEISTTTWAKGQGISFADMLKKKKEEAAAPVPEPVTQAPAASPKSTAAAEAPKKAEATPAAPAPAVKPDEPKPSTEAAKDADVPKPRRERKPRDAAPSAAPDAVAAAPAPAQPAVVAAAPAPVVATPVRVKYVVEFDRIADSVVLPQRVEDLAQRFGNTFVFNGTVGRAPTPPAPAPAPQQQQNFAAFQQPATRQAWPPATEVQRVNPASAPHWGEHNGANAWNRSSAPMNFTTYQQYPQQQAPYRAANMSYNRAYPTHQAHHYQHHPRSHAEHVASDVAYSAIRDDSAPGSRYNAGVW